MFSSAKPGLFKVLFSAILVASVFGFVYVGQQVYENSDQLNFSSVSQTAAVSNSVFDNVFCFFSGVFGFPCEDEIVYVPTVTEPLVENNLSSETPTLVPTYSSEDNNTSNETVIQNVTNEYTTNPIEKETIREVVIRNEQVSSSDFITRTEYERQVDGIMRSIENIDTSGGGGTSGLSNINSESIEDLSDVASMTKTTGDLLTWTGTAWTNIATSSLGIGGAVDSVNSQTGAVVLDTDDIAEGTNQYFTTARARDTLSSSAVGLSYATSTGVFSITSGYNIPLTASTTDWSTVTNLVNASSTFWDTAYSWGDHSAVGYLENGDNATLGNATTTHLRTNTLTLTGALTTGLADGCVEVAGGVLTSLGVACGTGGGGLTNLNGLTASSQSFATSTSGGLTFNITSSGGVHTFTLAPEAGYTIPLTASTTAWNTAYNTVTANSASWDAAAASTTALTPSYLRGLWSETVTGLDYASGVLSLTSGYSIPLTSSTTEWSTAYASTTALTPSYLRGLWSETVTGLDYASGVLSLTSGYTIPLTASTTEWASNSSQWTTTGSDIYYTTGNVGIGSSTPSSLLTVAGNGWFGGNLTATGTLAVLGTGTSTFAGDIEITGSIIPSADITYDLGSPTRQWRDVYIGPGSLYINGKKVLEDVSDTITLRTDLNQNLAMETSGIGGIGISATSTGNVAVTSAAGNISLNSGDGNIALGSVSGNININSSGGGNLNIGTSGGTLNLGVVATGTWNGTAIDISDYTNLGVSATGLSLSGDSIALTAGYTIPLTASTTEWDSKLSDISGLITAGSNVSITGSGTSGDPYSISSTGSDGVASSSVAFSVHKNGTNQTVTTGTYVKLTWPTEEFDTNNNFDTSTGRFTPTVAGKYLVSATANCTDSTTECDVYIYKNGAVYASSESYSSVVRQSTVTRVVEMNGTTDYVEVYVYNGGGTVISGQAIKTYFSGALIAPSNGLAGGWSNDETQSYLADYTDLVAIGTTTAAAKLDVWGSAGSTDILGISSSTGSRLLTLTSGGNLGIGTSTPSSKLSIQGTGNLLSLFDTTGNSIFNIASATTSTSTLATNLAITGNLSVSGSLYDSTDSAGTSGMVLQSTGSGFEWVATSTLGFAAEGGGSTGSSSVAFSVHKNGTAQSNGGGLALVTWSHEHFDTNNNFDLSTERFTPTVAGKYLIVAALYANGTSVYSYIYKNGSVYAISLDSGGVAGGTSAITTAIIDMNGTTDYVEMYGYNDSSQFYGDIEGTYFSGALIAPSNGLAGGWSNDETQSYLADYTDLVAIGTTTAAAKLDVWGSAGSTDILGISSSTGTRLLTLTSTGNIGLGTTTPSSKLSIVGEAGSDDIFSISSSTGSRLFTVTAAGNVGIGTSNPLTKLLVIGSSLAQSGGGTDGILQIAVGSAGGDAKMQFGVVDGDSSTGHGWIQSIETSSGYRNLSLNPGGGNVIIGGSSFVSGNDNAQFGASSYLSLSRSSTASRTQINFYNPNGAVGSVVTDGSATSYNTTSDRRVKNNIDYTKLGLDDLMQLPVRDFSFISDENGEITTGFIAQELYEIFPWAVTVNGDNGIDPLSTSTNPWSVDYGRLTPLLAKSIQDLNLKLEDLASSTVATSTLNAEGEEEPTFVGRFFARLVLWFADATNGIGTMMASVFQASDMICVDDECLTSDDIRQLKEGNNVNSPVVDVVDTDDGNDVDNDDGGGGSDAGDKDDTTPPPVTVVSGCTDELATNYNPDAIEDDGSCEYGDAEQLDATPVLGCTDTEALNYDSSATEDDDTCEYEEEPVEEPIDPVEPAEEPVQDDEEEEVVEDAPAEETATI